jgi:hypothetical protein
MLRKLEPGQPSKTLVLKMEGMDAFTEVWSGTIDSRDEFERMMVVVEGYAHEHGLSFRPHTGLWPPLPKEPGKQAD